MRKALIVSFIMIGCALVVSAQDAGTPSPATPQTPAAAPASPTVPATPTAFVIRGSVKSGKMPLPGVTISATNSLTGKKTITSTDIDGNFEIQPSSRGRYVLKAELPAFAVATNEAVINPTTPSAKVELELVLLSRVPKTTNDATAAMQQALTGLAANGRGGQSLSLSGTGFQGDSATTEVPTDAPALANTADASNESVSIAGQAGQTQDFGRNIDDIRDRIEEMRARGELGGPGGGGDMVVMHGGGGGPGGAIIMMGGPGGGGGGGRMFRGMNPNRPHGSFFYNVGNSVLDAAPYSLSGNATEKPSYSSNQFGGTIGGPLPKFLDKSQKTFLFLNVTGAISKQPYQVFSHVPTLAQRSGDFTADAPIYDRNGQQYSCNGTLNVICPNLLDSAATKLLPYIPLPNQTGAQNFVFTDSQSNDNVHAGFRLMRSFGTAPTAGPRRGPFGRNNVNFGFNYSRSSSDVFRPFPSAQGKSHNTGLALNGGYTFSRGKWTNNLRVNYNHSHTDTTNLYAGVTDIASQVGINGVSTDPQDWGLPGLSFANFTGLTDVNPVLRSDDVLQFGDMFIWRHGKHNIRTGVDYRRLYTDLKNNSNPRGTFTFTGLATSLNGAANTGYDFADFLLGVPQQTSIQSSPHDYQFRANGWNAYINDDWRVRGNITIELGLRYEYIGPYTEANNQLVNLDAAPGFSAVAPVQPGQTGPYNGVFPASLVNPDRNNWAPRVGIAYRIKEKTVIRAGYGINYNLGQYRSIVQQLAFQPPFSFTQTNILSASNPLTIENGFPTSTNQITNSYGVDPNYRLGYVQMWNLNIQRELKHNFQLNLGYTGSKGTALDIVRAPNRGPSGLLLPNVQSFLWESSQGSSILHAGTARLRRRFSKGVSVGATYTFSKSIDNASSIGGGATVVAQNDLDLAAERGLSSFNQKHKLNGDYTLDLPFGEGRKWLAREGAARTIFGDWELSGSFSVASGFPFTPRVLGAYTDVARGTNGTLRADYTGLPIALDNPSVLEWFNVAAFAKPAAGQFGNAGRNTIIGPRTVNFGMALSKNIKIKDTMGLELRAQASNVFNTPQFTSIDTILNSPTFGQVVGVGSTRRITMSARYRF